MIIESPQNKIFKEALSLKDKKHRKEEGVFLVEGLKQIEEIKDDWDIINIFISQSFSEKNDSGFKNGVILTDNLFFKLASTPSPQGIMAAVKKKKYGISRILNQDGFFVILENIQDPGNLGTIIRSADAFGAKGVFVSKDSADIYSDKTIRSTMGSIFNIPVIDEVDTEEAVTYMKKEKIKTFAASLAAKSSLKEMKLPKKCAVIIGNESNGIKFETQKLADNSIKIPMPGKAQSLNAAVAASIIMYEISVKQFSHEM